MKILAQDRSMLLDQPREVWVTSSGPTGTGLIVSSSKVFPVLGEYASEERAREVLREMFDYFRNGKNSYVMPEE